ncbi:MAG: ATP-binding cassette domain-containing protein [Anaerolineales bacterium]|nr:ATP-binding cassette domain-containing protein [Anaerolineales bacterium]
MAQLLGRPPSHVDEAPAIRMQGVNLRYNGAVALQDVSLSIQTGKLVAVVGPNGAGKSTLFKLIAGMEKPDKGVVRVFGHRPGGHVCIAYVPQRSQVDWTFPVTVTEVVMMGRIRKIGLFRWPSRQDWAFVHQALDKVGMTELAERQIGELSGGQQQRVFLAQALAQEAEIVLLDEPFSGLDLPSEQAIFVILQELRQTDVAVLVATHDLSLATEHFDQVVLLNRRVIAFGDPKDVFQKPHLLEAYSGYVHELSAEDGTVVLAEPCCGDEEEHHLHG